MNSGCSGLIWCLVMCACSRAVNSGVILSGGLWLHPFVTIAVMVFWSGCMSLPFIPFSPVTSIGRSPVCVLTSIFNDISPFADAISWLHLSCVGGWIECSSFV